MQVLPMEPSAAGWWPQNGRKRGVRPWAMACWRSCREAMWSVVVMGCLVAVCAVSGMRWSLLQPPLAEGHQVCRSEEHTSELQSPCNLVCRLLLEKKKKYQTTPPGSSATLNPDAHSTSPSSTSARTSDMTYGTTE